MAAEVTARPTHGRAVLVAAVLAAVTVTVVVLAMSASEPATLGQRTDRLAGQLRCPSCQGESAADSTSPVAEGMRAQIRSQLRAGRTDGQVRDWFRARYGDDVVLLPTGRPWTWVFWGVPVIVVAAGGAGVVLAARRRRVDASAVTGPPSRRLSARQLATMGVVAAVVGVGVPLAVRGAEGSSAAEPSGSAPAAAEPAAVVDWAGQGDQLDRAQSYEAALRAWRLALRDRPRSVTVRSRLGLDLLRLHRPGAAAAVVRPVTTPLSARRAPALLVLGLAERKLGHHAAATAALQRFLRVSPAGAEADQVRRLLAGTP